MRSFKKLFVDFILYIKNIYQKFLSHFFQISEKNFTQYKTLKTNYFFSFIDFLNYNKIIYLVMKVNHESKL